ncbi:two-component response regulator ORR24 [Sorghum bicolor]|uniref:Two-component response regulator n=1 Tax=Sorghum bicolor TaxID=4558 RepID=C5Y5J4_SORBI|nr:two-component response regulator ORR24 [Sorghum bicolor]EES09342.1 hypothetical protein SORBI_3005G050700 [Sorghum bicolor]|eukprot:XP_002450354.1 two-component response regulator ORR24 [Sorghum bicolor]
MDADTFPAGLRVLAVDDDRVCLKILERQLKYCNYNATVVTDARTALDMLRERKDGNQFDLVISDVVMPNMDGFKLLELIGLEMDLPVIMLSANNETQTIMKGIKHGACDYIVKPVRLEQLRGIWTHVVKNGKTDPRNTISSGNDDDVQKLPSGDELPSGDADKDENIAANRRKKYSKKNKRIVEVADEDNENTSAQKKQRVRWCGQLHRKFVEAVSQIGIDSAVPKKILKIMNVEGLTRENVASHLQKYRIYLKKLGDGTLTNSNSFADETEALWRNMNVPSFIGSPSSSNHFAKMNSSSTIGAQTLLPTQSIHATSSHKNLGIPRLDMETVGHGVNLPKDVMPMPVQDISRFVSSGKSYGPVSSDGLPGVSHCFPSGPSGNSFGNVSNDVPLKARKPFSIDISGSSFANSSKDSPPLTSNMCFSLSRSCSSYASILRGKILGSSRGIPFEDIANGEMLAPGHLPLQSPELVNQHLVQPQSCSASLVNKVAREVPQFAGPSNSWKVDVPSRFTNPGHNVGTSEDPSQGNILKINQLSRHAHSSGQVPTFGNEYQKKITGDMGKAIPVVGFREQVAPFNYGNFSDGNDTHSTLTPIGNSALASSSSMRLNQIDNSAMLTQVLNGGGASDSLHEGSTINQQAVNDQVNNINEFLMGTSEEQNVETDDLDDFLANLVNQDFIDNGDSFIDGDWGFAP